jgi:exonuclease III
MAGALRITTLNARSVKGIAKMCQLRAFMERIRPDVLLLQETNITQDDAEAAFPEYCTLANPPVRASTGTLIVCRQMPDLHILSHVIIAEGFAQMVRLGVGTGRRMQVICIVHVYVPNDRPSAMDVLAEVGATLATRLAARDSESTADIVIMAGDFNCTLSPRYDRVSRVEKSPVVARRLAAIVRRHDLCDVWREKRGREEGFTYHSPADPGIASRLDRFYVERHALASVRTVSLLPSFSDHYAVTIECVVAAAFSYPPPYWRFRNVLLENDGYVVFMSDVLRELQHSHDDPVINWELIKSEAQATTKIFEKISRGEDHRLLRQLEESAMANSGLRAWEGRAEVRNWYAEGGETTSAIRGWEDVVAADKPAGSHLSRAVRRLRPQPLTSLDTEEGLLTETGELATYIGRHFAKVFEADVGCSGGATPTARVLPEDSRLFCEADLTSADYDAALEGLTRGKAPGMDGLTVEFYRRFWRFLRGPFVAMADESFRRGCLPLSARRAVISLLHKKGDRQTLRNWRPVSLTNTDYKVIAKALATRLRSVIADVVSEEQGCGVPGRSILDNVAFIRDAIRWANDTRENLAILALDQQGAFDRVEHQFLFRTLREMQFGEAFIKKVATLYAQASCVVRVGNSLTPPVALGRGVRQGCPMSGHLYAIAIEPLLLRIKRSVSGMLLPSTPPTRLGLSAYADDVTVFLTDAGDLEAIHSAFSDYAAQSGARLNREKSTGLLCGPWRRGGERPRGCYKWATDGAKFLGVWLGNDPVEERRRVEADLSDRVRLGIARWERVAGRLSLRGRVRVANQYLAPKLWHTLHHVQLGTAAIRSLQAIFVDFVWGGGRHWVDAETLCAPVGQGGLGLVDVRDKVSAFRIQSVMRYLAAGDDDPRRALTSYFFSQRATRLSFYASVRAAWESLEVKRAGEDGRPTPTGWPPPTDVPSAHFFVENGRRERCSLPLKKRDVYVVVRHKGKADEWPIKGRLTDDAVLWGSLYRTPSFGRDRDVAWRLAHDRLADAVFLHRAGLRDDRACRWCPDAVATTWHVMYECSEAKVLWRRMRATLKEITGRGAILVKDVHCGFDLGRWKQADASLANYVVTLGKACIYKCFTAAEKGTRSFAGYWAAFIAALKRRVLQEYTVSRARRNLEVFTGFWCHRRILCRLGEDGDLELGPLLREDEEDDGEDDGEDVADC